MPASHLVLGTAGQRFVAAVCVLALTLIVIVGVVIYSRCKGAGGGAKKTPYPPAIAYVGENGVVDPQTFFMLSENGCYSLIYDAYTSTFDIYRHVAEGKQLISWGKSDFWSGKVVKLGNDGRLTHHEN